MINKQLNNLGDAASRCMVKLGSFVAHREGLRSIIEKKGEEIQVVNPGGSS